MDRSALALLVVVPFFCLSFSAHSQDFREIDGYPAEDIIFQDIESVYSASKYEQNITEAPARISVITAEEIRRYGYRTLSEVLNSLPDFYVSYDRNYTYTGVRGFSLTGDYDTKILQLVDGHRVNDSVYDSSSTEFGYIVDVDQIKRIEVVRGPSSSIYGSSAFFAVVNVITKRGRDLQGMNISGSAGTFDSYKTSLSYGKKYDNDVEVYLSGSFYDSDGDDKLYFAEFDDPSTNNGIAEDADYEDAVNLLLNISYNDFTLQGAFVEREKGIPTASYDGVFNDPRSRTEDTRAHLALKYQRLLENKTDLTFRLYYDYYHYAGTWIYDYSDAGDLSDLAEFYDEAFASWWGAEVIGTRRFWDKHKLSFGGEFRGNFEQTQEEYDDFEWYLDDSRDEYTWGIFLQDEYTFRENLIFTLGLRYDEYSSMGSTVNPRIAAIYSPARATTVKLMYGTAFRAPNAYELYYQDGPLTQKKPDGLDSEEIETYELVVEQRISDIFRLSGSIYHNKLENLITLTEDPADGLLIFDNIGNAEVTGGDIQLEARWDNDVTSSVSYAYQKAENGETGEWLFNSPEHLVKLKIMAPLFDKRLLAGFEAHYQSGRRTLADSETDDFVIGNLTLINTSLLKGLTISASVYNIFDQEYGYPGSAEHAMDSIEQDGRTFRLKLDYSF